MPELPPLADVIAAANAATSRGRPADHAPAEATVELPARGAWVDPNTGRTVHLRGGGDPDAAVVTDLSAIVETIPRPVA